jgi:uncharacterized repeat protein (TIGR03803 family)
VSGSSFVTVYNFTVLGGANFTNADGSAPLGNLVQSGASLYGTTFQGGSNGFGTVFEFTPATSNLNTLYTFTSGADGAQPRDGLILSGTTLYGTASAGGAYSNGTVFKLNTDGSGFTVLHSFSATHGNVNSDGASPAGGLLLSGNVLYGTTYYGGNSSNGTVFQVDTDGSDFITLVDFGPGPAPANSSAGLILSNNFLYGTTQYGGSAGNGTVFGLNLSEAPAILYIAPAGKDVVLKWDNPFFGLQSAPGVKGAYTNIAGAASLYTNPISGAEEFFRLQSLP